MDTGEITIGMKVRYPRTGTEGLVEKIEEIGGRTFAEIDTTHLLYRVDVIIPVEKFREKARGMEISIEEELGKGKMSAEELQKAYDHTDGECGG
jgi:hypothetical protein